MTPTQSAAHPCPTPLRSWLSDWSILAGAVGLAILVMFSVWEIIERRYGHSDEIVRRFHFARGISSSLVAATVLGWLTYQQHRRRAVALEDEVARRTQELREARATLQAILDNTPSALMVLDSRFRVLEANRSAERVHDLALVGHRCFERLAGRDAPCEDCPATETFETGSPRATTEHMTDPRTGEMLTIETHPLDLPSGERCTLVIERVVTEQRKLQARLIHQEKMAAFGLLAAGIAHDLGNPLSSIEMYLQLLAQSKLDDEPQEMVGTMREETARLRRILRELVDFARRRRDEASWVSVQAVAEDALRLLRHEPRMRRIDVHTRFDPASPPVELVEDHLMQVTMNLLINAVDAMPDGGRLDVETQALSNGVVLRIKDTGVGMDRAVLGRCFEPLFTTKEVGRGTGLGLSICRDIIRNAGGDIELHSSPGRGTTAVVRLFESAPDDSIAPTSRTTVAAEKEVS
ncbi:MAG: ATP-binding protein [Planctomycetota bacterium]